MATVYSYVRFSSRKQAQGGSLGRQVENGDKWIQSNDHTKASLTLHDLGVSAFRGKNKHKGALKTFLNAIEEGKIKKGSILLIEHLDRLSRQGVMEALPIWLQILNAGVKIAVLKPSEHIYTKPRDETEAFVGLLLPLVYFHLAHIESKNKSDRIRREWTKKRKETTEDGNTLTKKCPTWMEWDKTKKSFQIRPEGKKAIRHIFQRTIDGVGQRKLVAELSEKFKPIGYSKTWNTSFVQKILSDKSVLGEFQMNAFDDEGNRIPQGEPIPDYYPRIIDDATWYKAQQAKATRKKQKGPNGQFVNLFTGMVFNARDHYPCHIQTTRSTRTNGDQHIQRRFVSYGYLRRIKDTCPITCDYYLLETSILQFLRELNSADLLPESQKDTSVLNARTDDLLAVCGRLSELQNSLEDPGSNLETVLKAVSKLEERKRELSGDVERLKRELVNDDTDSLQKAQSLLELLQSTPEDERADLRMKLRTVIPDVIEQIWVAPFRLPKRKTMVFVQINLKDGRFRKLMITPTNVVGTIDPVESKKDLRNPDHIKEAEKLVEFLVRNADGRGITVGELLARTTG